MKVNTASNSKLKLTAPSTVITEYNKVNIAATFAKSRSFRYSKWVRDELKLISTLTLSQERASVYSGTFLINDDKVSHLSYSANAWVTSSSNMNTNYFTQPNASLPLLFLINILRASKYALTCPRSTGSCVILFMLVCLLKVLRYLCNYLMTSQTNCAVQMSRAPGWLSPCLYENAKNFRRLNKVRPLNIN